MPERKATVGSAQGLHARPAKLLVQAAAAQSQSVMIAVAGRPPVPAASMLGVLSLAAVQGTELTLTGDSAEALDAVAAVIEHDHDADVAKAEDHA